MNMKPVELSFGHLIHGLNYLRFFLYCYASSYKILGAQTYILKIYTTGFMCKGQWGPDFLLVSYPQGTSGYWSLTAVGKKLFLRLVLQHWRPHNLLNKDKNSRSQGGRHLPRCWQPFSCGGGASVQLSLLGISTGEHAEALPTAHLSSLRSLVFFTVMKRLSSLLRTLQMFHLFSVFPLVASQHCCTTHSWRVKCQEGTRCAALWGATAEGDAGGKGLMVCNSLLVK